jgi:hypothetical protein
MVEKSVELIRIVLHDDDSCDVVDTFDGDYVDIVLVGKYWIVIGLNIVVLGIIMMEGIFFEIVVLCYY